jgi:polyhydroxyalkanoate synthesis regulator phasin
MRASERIIEIASSVAYTDDNGMTLIRTHDLVHALQVYIDELEERVRKLEAKVEGKESR